MQQHAKFKGWQMTRGKMKAWLQAIIGFYVTFYTKWDVNLRKSVLPSPTLAPINQIFDYWFWREEGSHWSVRATLDMLTTYFSNTYAWMIEKYFTCVQIGISPKELVTFFGIHGVCKEFGWRVKTFTNNSIRLKQNVQR